MAEEWVVVYQIDNPNVPDLTEWWDKNFTEGITDLFPTDPFQASLVIWHVDRIPSAFCAAEFAEEPSGHSMSALSNLWAQANAGNPVLVVKAGISQVRIGSIERIEPPSINPIGIGRSIIVFKPQVRRPVT